MESAPRAVRGQARLPAGQALIVILLVLAVAATVVLSLLSRTVTDVTITSKDKESSRAFSAAEAGVEGVLVGGATSGTLSGGEQFSVAVGQVGEGANEFIWPQEVMAGDTVPVWFVSHAADGSLTCADGKCFVGASVKVCWGKEGTPPADAQTPALEVVIIYKSSGNYKIGRVAVDPNSSRTATNKFDAPDANNCAIGGKVFPFGETINFTDLGIPSSVYNAPDGLQTARIRLIYNTASAHPIAISAPAVFPSQGKKLVSTGTAGEASRKIEVFQGFTDLPPIFDFAAFSAGGLTK